MSRDFLSIRDLNRAQALSLLERSLVIKKDRLRPQLLAGKTVALIFEKASTRTRVSFEVAIRHLGGQSLFLTPADTQLGRSEPLADTARVLSRYIDGLVVRTFSQEILDELATYASIPVVNALSDLFHPCQVMSDVLTMAERSDNLVDLTVAWIGDGNNMAHSFINAAARFPFKLRLACPEGYAPRPEILDQARREGADVFLTDDPTEAVQGAHFVNTDVWASMGQEQEQRQRAKAFAGFCVDKPLLAHAHPEVKVMHCLPAHRGEEISSEVLEGPWSIVWDQAENRLHMQKAILEWVFEA